MQEQVAFEAKSDKFIGNNKLAEKRKRVKITINA